MYKQNKKAATSILVNMNELENGESMIKKIRRIVHNQEPINEGAPLLYTSRRDGVVEDYDIRADRFDAVLNATDVKTKSLIAKRDNNIDIGKISKEIPPSGME